ncbi:MAG TPA: two-component regulator propeller domain-containing protein, partial [Lacibacter sp.]|nr:two-component regulator propeller domain-containing protein [Lacibacter sp.]
MKKLIAILLLPFSAFCQNTIGLPEVINYPRQTYQGGTQNWDFQQDRSGILYVANNEGLLNFDGSSWSLHSLPNKTIVRSVRIGPDERIYVGGQDEMGYFQPDRNGNLVYQSFTSQVPEKSRSFGDVWDIVTRQKDVFFRSAGKIFQMTGNQAVVYEAPSEWAFMGMCNSRLYAHDAQAGLFVFENNIWNPLPGTDLLPKSDPVTAILPSKEGRLLLTTLKNGLFYYDGNKINRHPSPNNRIFSEERVYAAIALDENWLALATSNKGVYIVDRKGNIIQQFSKAEQLQNNNVLSIFLDQQKNLWLGLDNGIDLIAYNSAIKHITPMLQDASGYAALIHNGHLYA